jgi:hypothetical protein
MGDLNLLNDFRRLACIIATHAPDGFPAEGFNTFRECQLAACNRWRDVINSFEYSESKSKKIDKKFIQGLIILDVYETQIELGIKLDPALREKGRDLLWMVNDMLSRRKPRIKANNEVEDTGA